MVGMEGQLAPSPKSGRAACAAIVLLLIAAAAFCYWRTMGRVGNRVEDFAVYWASSRAMLDGRSPYDQAQVVDVWMRNDGGRFMASFGELRAIASPTATLMTVPMALLPLPVAVASWWVVGFASLLACGWMAGRLAGLRGCVEVGLMFALALVWGPADLSLSAGQPALLCALLLMASLLLGEDSKPLAAGVALGLAIAIKPQLGCIAIPWCFVRGQWRSVVVAAMVAGLVGLAALVAVRHVDAGWYQHWMANLRQTFAPDAVNDFGFGNPTRDHFLNLQALGLGLAGGSRAAAQVFAWGLAAIFAVIWAARVRRPGSAVVGAMSVWAILLVPVYHRYYDAIVLLPAAAWCIGRIARRRFGWPVVLVGIAVAGLITPVGWPMNVINKGVVPHEWGQTAAWRVVVQPYAGWLMLMMVTALVGEMMSNDEYRQPND